MADTATPRLFEYLYFKPVQMNGTDVPGKYHPLRVRLLYASMEQVPAGRVHLYEYAKKKYSSVLCLHNGETTTALKSSGIVCPMCAQERYGTPSTTYYAYVIDMEDNKFKLLKLNWGTGTQIDAVATLKAKPLHDLVLVISKQGVGKNTTFTVIPDEVSKFSVADYFQDLGLTTYPPLVGKPGERTPILALSASQMTDFLGGKYPWSSGENFTPKKHAVLGSTVTEHVENPKISAAIEGAKTSEEAPVTEDDAEDAKDFEDDAPTPKHFF